MNKIYLLVLLLTLGLILASGVSADVFNSISLSQNVVNVSAGQSATVYIYSNTGSNAFYIAGNSNSSVASAGIMGNTLTIYGINAGNSTISLCTTSNLACTNLAAIVYGSGGGNAGDNISLSQTIVSLNPNLSFSDYIYSNISNNSFYVSSNSNSNIVSAAISGNTLNLTGLNPGTATVNVCSNSNSGCASVYVTVNSTGYVNLNLSQTSVNLNAGSNTVVYAYNNSGSLYVSSNSNSFVANATVSGNQINIYGYNTGSANVMVCAQNSQCATIYVTVNGYNSGNLYFTNITPPQAVVGQYYNYSILLSGGTTPYNLSLYSGALPPGLMLAPGGLLSGVPSVNGNYNFTVRASDSSGRSAISPNINLGVGYTLGTNTYASGSLIREGNTVYLVYKNMKSGFASLPVFKALGYRLENVAINNGASLTNSGFVVNSPNMAHPWGSWIRSGNTVYFVSDLGLIPVPSWDIFVSNGGAGSYLVTANLKDFDKPILPVMAYSDYRLH